MSKRENGCAGLINHIYQHECVGISADCVAEGYPARGSNYDLRVSGLWEEYYAEWYSEAETYRNPGAFAEYKAKEEAERDELRRYQEEWRKNHSLKTPVYSEPAQEAIVEES